MPARIQKTWLQMKLYASRNAQDVLISGRARSFAEKAQRSGLADAWFFVRGFDTDPYLRVCFLGEKDRMLKDLLPSASRLAAGLLAEQRCFRFSFDAYGRDVERYGGAEGVRAWENFFTADSRAVADLLMLLDRGDSLHLDRTVLAVVSADHLLGSFGLGPAQRADWCLEHLPARRRGRADYEPRRAVLLSLLGRTEAQATERLGKDVAAVLARRARDLAPFRGLLTRLEKKGGLDTPRTEIHRGLLHVHLNRLMFSDKACEQGVINLVRRTRKELADSR